MTADVMAPGPRGNAPPPRLPQEDAAHFDAIAALAHAEAGLVLSRDKAPMVLARIGKRIRKLGVPDLGAYRTLVESAEGAEERRELLYVLTTNVTSFFREKHHFEALRERVLAPIVPAIRAGRRLRLWSAGCSTGQEAYTIAMTVLDVLPDAASHDVRILATDIDRHVLATARRGLFNTQQVETMPQRLRDRYLEGVPVGPVPTFAVAPELRNLVTFRELNLLSAWPMKGRFDAIFCRNVVIYFDRDTQARLWPRFHHALAPGGLLFLGHSERMEGAADGRFRTVGTTTYERLEPVAPAPERI